MTKDAGQYGPANFIFALLLGEYFKGDSRALSLEYEDAGIRGEVFMDLPALRGAEGQYLCIPAPLLYEDVLIDVLKKAKVVKRQEHGRETTKASPAKFWQALVIEVGGTRFFATLLDLEKVFQPSLVEKIRQEVEEFVDLEGLMADIHEEARRLNEQYEPQPTATAPRRKPKERLPRPTVIQERMRR